MGRLKRSLFGDLDKMLDSAKGTKTRQRRITPDRGREHRANASGQLASSRLTLSVATGKRLPCVPKQYARGEAR